MLFKDFVQITPKVDLKKGKTYPYVGMADVNPSRGYVTNSETREYKNSRSKFKEGDTLFARITPCLENGKITRFKSDGIKKGFGSTEFFVFRAKEGVSDPNFVYYLSRSPLIRKTAEKSMAGASGRQRADITAVEEVEIDPPDLPTQQKIASILSAFDNLIENNSRRIEILEEMARRIYREWFMHFRYPGHEDDELVDSGTELGEIPEGWEVKQIQDIVDRSNSGLKPIDHPDEEFYYYSFSAYDEGQRPEVIKGEEIKSRKYILDDDAVIISKLNPRIPRIWYAKPKTDLRCLTSTEFLILNGVDGISNAFVYSLLRSHKFYGRFRSLTGGTSTSHQRVKPKDFKKMEIVLPEKGLLNKFQNKARQLFDLAHNLREKNEKLKETRDLLLPKLISGKIDIEEITVN